MPPTPVPRRAVLLTALALWAASGFPLSIASGSSRTVLPSSVVSGVSRTTQTPTAESSFAVIATLVNDAIARGELPGAVVLIGQGDAVLYSRAFGRRAVAPTTEVMTIDTILDIASLTKVVATTTSVMQLIEGGRIGLDDSVAKYISGFDRHGKGGITIRDLLTHVSGLRPDFDLNVEFNGANEALRRASQEVPVARPGERFVYSDINFLILGEIVQRVSGERLDRYAKTHIFEPLLMKDTMFLPPAALRARIAPTERCLPLAWPCDRPDAPFLRGTVHDPTARRMGGVAGHAGLFSTAADLSRFCRMLLNNGQLGSVRILSPATVVRMTSPSTPPALSDVRGLGWDIDSTYSTNRGELFPLGSYGHTGFTGTSMWLDPTTKSYVIFLSNRVHPDGKGDVTALRGQVATAAAAGISTGERADPPWHGPFSTSDRAASASAAPARDRGRRPAGTHAEPTLAGIDVLAAEGFTRLRGKRVALLTNQSGRSRDGRSTIDLLTHAPGVTVVALFSPEHGIRGELDERVPSSRDEKTGLPIHSLYDESRRPTGPMLQGIDTIVVDLQDVGARFYSYPAAIAYVMEETARRKIAVVVLDRPNPIDGLDVEGPMQDESAIGYNGYCPMPIRHGMTIGELSRLLNGERQIGADLTVVSMKNWHRDDWFDQTGLPWINPSPNMRNLVAATLYPGIGAIERTNISVGRGTDAPFEQIGAPWINGVALAEALNARGLAGVRFYPVNFTPAAGATLGGQLCEGVFMVVTDREQIHPVRVGLEIATALSRMYGSAFKLEDAASLFGSSAMLARIRAGENPATIAASWPADEAKWGLTRAKYLLY